MPFGLWTRVGSRKHVLGGVHTGATWQIPLNHPCTVAMQPFCHIALTTWYYYNYGVVVFINTVASIILLSLSLSTLLNINASIPRDFDKFYWITTSCQNQFCQLISKQRSSAANHHNRFTAVFPGPPGWASARRELLDFMVQGKINRGRHNDHSAGRHSIQTNQCLWQVSQSCAEAQVGWLVRI